MVKRRFILAVAIGLTGAGSMIPATPSLAETVSDLIARRTQKASSDKKERLMVESRELVYDRDRNTVAAVGNAQLYYQGRVLEADKVIYDRNTNRVYAEGNAKMTEANGQVLYGERFEVSDDFKDGFIDSLRVDTVEKTHFVAPRGERTQGDATVFDKGTYTACDACKDDPAKPPLWQVRAKRIIHRNEERMIYYEDATLEFWGIPVAWIPYFSTPDATVKRKTGFLAPRYVTSGALGVGVSIPFFWELAPDYDLTITPTLLSRQGLLGSVEWRQRLMNGSYQIRASGIFQQDPGAFLQPPFGAANRSFRGEIDSMGRFLINDRWQYGWNAIVPTDKWFLQNYKYRSNAYSALGTFSTMGFREATSTVYLQGQGDRSWFDARGYYFRGLSYTDWQAQLPVALPVIDYDRRFTPTFLGGELTLNANITNINRQETDFISLVQQNGITPGRYLFPIGYNQYGQLIQLYDTCAPGQYNPQKCFIQGIGGNYTRASGEVSWRRTFIDPIGQTWTPFAGFRGDLAYTSLNLTGFFNPYQTNFFTANDQVVPRGMAAAGVTYRFPFVASSSFGSHVIEPIAQVIARPNEGQIGKIPNEDAQSLVFDDTNLFEVNKFSGYDRVEGGGRANVGAQYTFTNDRGGYVSALFGQSYQIFGQNPYSMASQSRVGADSGLATTRSDYVSRIAFAPTTNFNIIGRARFDENDFSAKRVEVQASATFDLLTASIIYARYAAQPQLGQFVKREGLSTSARLNLTRNWYVSGGVLFDLSRNSAERFYQMTGYQTSNPATISGMSLGGGYKDECTTFGLVYTDSGKQTLADGTKERSWTVLMRLELRTLGSVSYSYNVTTTSQDGITP